MMVIFLMSVICFALGIWYGHGKADPIQSLVNDAKLIVNKAIQTCKRVILYFTKSKNPFSKSDPFVVVSV